MTPSPDYLAPYTEATAAHGPTFDALLWRNPEMQRVRFDALIDAADPTGKAVADLGCGLADLLARLNERNVGHARYLGVEAVPDLAAAARDRLDAMGYPGGASRRAEIIAADFASDASIWGRLISDERVDVLFFSGSLNTFEQPAAMAVLDRAWDAARGRPGVTLAFNFLSDRCDPARRAKATGPAHRFDTLAMLDWALRRTTLVRFRHDYLAGHDAAIAMTTA